MNAPNITTATMMAPSMMAVTFGSMASSVKSVRTSLSTKTATMGAFIMATQIVNQDPAVAFLLAMMPAVLIGLVNGIGVGVFRVHPLIILLILLVVILQILRPVGHEAFYAAAEGDGGDGGGAHDAALARDEVCQVR